MCTGKPRSVGGRIHLTILAALLHPICFFGRHDHYRER